MTHVSISEILDIARRRKTYFLVPFLVISLISAIGAFLMPKRYESYTTILVKGEKINPLNWMTAVEGAQQNQLGLFNEIVRSRTTIQTLLDSLGQAPDPSKNQKWDDLIEGTRTKVGTEIRGNDSFRITYADSDPFITQRAVTVLCNIYIQVSLKSDRQQAEETVKFLEAKVEELRKEFDQAQQAYVSSRHTGLAQQPDEEISLRPRLAREQEEFTVVEQKLQQQQRTMSQIRFIQQNLDDPATMSKISALDPEGVTSYVDTLKALALKYNQLLIRYKPNYPRVQAVREDVIGLLEKSAEALQSAIQNTQAKKASLASLRDQTLGGLSRSINVQAYGTERSAEFFRVKENFDAAKQRLDQAKVTKELADRGASKYVILDPAQVPDRPTKPKKMPIIGGGLAVGLIVGIAAMWMMEYYDPTVRRRQDIEIFNKPIIGYLP